MNNRINEAIVTGINTEYKVNLNKSKLGSKFLNEGLGIHGKLCIEAKFDISTNIIEEIETKIGYNSKWNTRVERVGIFSYAEWSEEEKVKDKEITYIKYKTLKIKKEFYIDIEDTDMILLDYKDSIVYEHTHRYKHQHILSVLFTRVNKEELKEMKSNERILELCDYNYERNLLNNITIDYDILKDTDIIFNIKEEN